MQGCINRDNLHLKSLFEHEIVQLKENRHISAQRDIDRFKNKTIIVMDEIAPNVYSSVVCQKGEFLQEKDMNK